MKHPHVLDTANAKWAHRAVWAPSVIEKNAFFYIFFGANDIQNDDQTGGIGVARPPARLAERVDTHYRNDRSCAA